MGGGPAAWSVVSAPAGGDVTKVHPWLTFVTRKDFYVSASDRPRSQRTADDRPRSMPLHRCPAVYKPLSRRPHAPERQQQRLSSVGTKPPPPDPTPDPATPAAGP